MITEYRIRGTLGIAGGMLCHLVGFIAVNLVALIAAGHAGRAAVTHAAKATAPGLQYQIVVGYTAQVVAILVLTYGCVNYARAKGYDSRLGLLNLIGLTGLLGPPALLFFGFSGLVIVCAVPDRTPPEFTPDAQRQAHDKIRAAARRENKPPGKRMNDEG